MSTILITGATGGLGGTAIDLLLEKAESATIKALSENNEKISIFRS